MGTQDFNDILTALDENVFKYDHQYVNAAVELHKAHEASMTAKQKAQMQFEADAFMVHTTDTLRSPKEPRFRSHFDFTQAHFEYYAKRVKTTKSPPIKQRLADILWEYGGKEINKGDIGKILVESSLEAVNLLDQNENEFERLDCATRALQIAKFLEKQPGELSTKASSVLMTLVEDYVNKDQVRYTLELLNAVIAIPSLFSKDELKRCREVCEIGINHFKTENDNFTLRGSFVEKKYALDKIIDPATYDPKELAKDKAQSQIDEAERRTDSPMVQQHFLVEAEKILKDAGLNDEARAARLRVEDIGKSEGYDKQFQEFSFETRIPQEEIDQLEAVLTKYEDVSAVIAISPNFIPSWTRSVEAANNDNETHISDLFTSTTIDDNGMVVAVEKDDSRKRTLRYYNSEVELKLSFLRKLLRKLISEDKINAASFEHQFKKLDIIDKNLGESVRHAIDLYLLGGKNCYSAALILSTQLEDFMWKMLPLMETEQYIFEKDGITQSPKTMGWFLQEMKDFFGEDLYELMHYTLTDKAHHNLRNKIGHGKTHINMDNEMICVRMIQLFAALLVHVNLTEVT